MTNIATRAARLALALVLGVSLPGGAAWARTATAEPAVANYDENIAKLRNGDLAVDFTALRREHSKRAGYLSMQWGDAKANFAKLDTDAAGALAGAQAALAEDYLNLEAHLLAEIALKRLDRAQDAAVHHEVLLALLRSVMEGKDGRTAAAAWNATSVPEEYFVLMILGYQPEGQSLVNDKGGTFDVMHATDRKSGEKVDLWFDISSFFGKEFGGLEAK